MRWFRGFKVTQLQSQISLSLLPSFFAFIATLFSFQWTLLLASFGWGNIMGKLYKYKRKWLVKWNIIFAIFKSMLHGFFVFSSGPLYWIFVLTLPFAQFRWQSCLWQGHWSTWAIAQFRGEWDESSAEAIKLLKYSAWYNGKENFLLSTVMRGEVIVKTFTSLWLLPQMLCFPNVGHVWQHLGHGNQA